MQNSFSSDCFLALNQVYPDIQISLFHSWNMFKPIQLILFDFAKNQFLIHKLALLSLFPTLLYLVTHYSQNLDFNYRQYLTSVSDSKLKNRFLRLIWVIIRKYNNKINDRKGKRSVCLDQSCHHTKIFDVFRISCGNLMDTESSIEKVDFKSYGTNESSSRLLSIKEHNSNFHKK